MAFFLHAARRKEMGQADPDFSPPVFPTSKVNTFDTESTQSERLEQGFDSLEKSVLTKQHSKVVDEQSAKPKRKFATRGQSCSDTRAAAPKPLVEEKLKKDLASDLLDLMSALTNTKVSAQNPWDKPVPLDRTKYNMSKRGVLSMTETLEAEGCCVQGMSEEERGKIFRLGNRIVDAAKSGNLKKLKVIVQACGKGMLVQWSICKAFLAACEGDHLEIVRFMMANGVHPTANPGVSKAMHLAVTHKCSSELITFLSLAGFDVNKTIKPQNFTPLHIAAVTKNVQAVECLLGLGADPNAVASDANDSMPLTLATKVAKDPACINLIQKAGGRMSWRKPTAKNLPASTGGAKYVSAGGYAGQALAAQ